MKEARNADPEKFRERRRHIYHTNADYREALIGRIRQRRRSNPSRYLWEKARTRARKKGVEFTISVSDVVIPDRCPAIGIPITVLSKTRDNSPNLDRIDATRGYVPGNVAVISARANRIKSDATLIELRGLIRYIRGAL